MYSVPGRSVQRFLQARLQVWHPMHLSRWNTMEICERTFITESSSIPLRLALQFVDDHVRIAIGGRRPVIVESIAILCVASGHQHGLEPHARDAVGPSTSTPPAEWRLGKRNGPLGRVIEDADAARDPRADHGARHDDSIVVVRLHPVIIQDADLCGITVIQPEWFNTA